MADIDTGLLLRESLAADTKIRRTMSRHVCAPDGQIASRSHADRPPHKESLRLALFFQTGCFDPINVYCQPRYIPLAYGLKEGLGGRQDEGHTVFELYGVNVCSRCADVLVFCDANKMCHSYFLC